MTPTRRDFLKTAGAVGVLLTMSRNAGLPMAFHRKAPMVFDVIRSSLYQYNCVWDGCSRVSAMATLSQL